MASQLLKEFPVPVDEKWAVTQSLLGESRTGPHDPAAGDLVLMVGDSNPQPSSELGHKHLLNSVCRCSRERLEAAS